MMELKYSEILKLNKKLGNNFKSSSYNITVLSNIIISSLFDTGNSVLSVIHGEDIKTGEGKVDKIMNQLESTTSKSKDKLNEEFGKMKDLISYNRKTQ